MNKHLLALGALLALTSCASVHVKDTQTATGATHPTAIYIRPFDVSGATFAGKHGDPGEEPIRRSLAPAEWSLALKHELEKIAPAIVLKPNERPSTGWLVDGSLDVIDAGSPKSRFFAGADNPFGFGRSKVAIHVRIRDVAGESNGIDDKDSSKGRKHGDVIYEFDLEGGSNRTGGAGSLTAPGAGYAVPFDFKNAAERVRVAISPDAFVYGERTSTTLR